MNDISSLTSAQLRHVADLKEKISALEHELASIFGSPSTPAPAPKTKLVGNTKTEPLRKGRRKMSAAARARMAKAAKARWAKAKAAGKSSL